MDFDLTKEQQIIQKAAREFARGEFPAVARDLDINEAYPAEIVKKARELDLIGLFIPEEYGGAVMGMCCVGMGVDLMLAWPIAQLVVLDTTAAVNLIFRREIQAAEDPESYRQQKIEEYDYKYSNPYHAASNMLVDSVIKPRETRPQLIKALKMLRNKKRPEPNKRHGNIPL